MTNVNLSEGSSNLEQISVQLRVYGKPDKVLDSFTDSVEKYMRIYEEPDKVLDSFIDSVGKYINANVGKVISQEEFCDVIFKLCEGISPVNFKLFMYFATKYIGEDYGSTENHHEAFIAILPKVVSGILSGHLQERDNELDVVRCAANIVGNDPNSLYLKDPGDHERNEQEMDNIIDMCLHKFGQIQLQDILDRGGINEVSLRDSLIPVARWISRSGVSFDTIRMNKLVRYAIASQRLWIGDEKPSEEPKEISLIDKVLNPTVKEEPKAVNLLDPENAAEFEMKFFIPINDIDEFEVEACTDIVSTLTGKESIGELNEYIMSDLNRKMTFTYYITVESISVLVKSAADRLNEAYNLSGEEVINRVDIEAVAYLMSVRASAPTFSKEDIVRRRVDYCVVEKFLTEAVKGTLAGSTTANLSLDEFDVLCWLYSDSPTLVDNEEPEGKVFKRDISSIQNFLTSEADCNNRDESSVGMFHLFGLDRIKQFLEDVVVTNFRPDTEEDPIIFRELVAYAHYSLLNIYKKNLAVVGIENAVTVMSDVKKPSLTVEDRIRESILSTEDTRVLSVVVLNHIRDLHEILAAENIELGFVFKE